MGGGFGHEIGVYNHDRAFRFYNSDEPIEDGRWILEIIIYDKEINRSAFYENVIGEHDIQVKV